MTLAKLVAYAGSGSLPEGEGFKRGCGLIEKVKVPSPNPSPRGRGLEDEIECGRSSFSRDWKYEKWCSLSPLGYMTKFPLPLGEG